MKDQIREWWSRVVRDYFTFSAGERNGVIVLCILIVILAFLPLIFRTFQKDEEYDFTSFQDQIDSFIANNEKGYQNDSLKEAVDISDLEEVSSGLLSENKATLFQFDPNTATVEDFRKLGINDKLIKTIINYRLKGGKFNKKEDIKKIYGFSDLEFLRLEPYIVIHAEAESETRENNDQEKTSSITTSKIIELNQADSIELLSLPMIGPTLTSRIIKYRKLLGGFCSISQLNEVYGLLPETFNIVKENVKVDISFVTKINLNTISIDSLKRHPYFKTIAIPLINYRNQHGSFNSIEEIRNVDVVSQDIYIKIVPYISLK